MAAQERPYQPSLPWRLTSAINVGIVGFLCRSVLYTLNRTEVRGLERFLQILDGRKDEKARTKGLVTGEFSTFLPFGVAWLAGLVACLPHQEWRC
jgi:monolysocardiolipin acyltransferase